MKPYFTLRWKLTLLTASGGIVAAAIAAAGFTGFGLYQFWLHMNEEVRAVGNVIADQAGPALTLGDRTAAGGILNSLAAEHRVQRAYLYDARGECFASYPPHMPSRACPPCPPDGFRRNGQAETLVVALPVATAAGRLGTLMLVVQGLSAFRMVQQYLGSTLLVFALSLLTTAAVAAVLERSVSAPVLHVAHVAQRITKTHRFSDRVAVRSTDELAVLAESFNSMLEEIERRDAELAQHRHTLEERVTERNRVNSELRAAKEKAEAAALLKSQFLANISHEIRTPMNGVVGMISLVLQNCADPEQREQLLVAQSAAEALVTLLNNILDLSKIEAGKMSVEAIDFELQSVVQEALQLFRPALCDKNLEARLFVSPDCPKVVCGDPLRLRQILTNLLGNAVKFTAKGRVQLDVTAVAPGRLRFAVRDTGIGIAPDKQEEIFDAFTQADGSHTRRFGGSGLGLTITRRLVDLMGGELHVESRLGEGSLFCFELPLPAGGAQTPETAPRHVVFEPAPLLQPIHVLIAEDNSINQQVISSILLRQGCSVQLADNGRRAFEAYLREEFDLVLMDIQMPEMDGVTAAGAIRQDERMRKGSGRRVPIVALTAHTNPVEHQRYLAAGMDAVITKPVTVGTLVAGITAALAPRKTEGGISPEGTLLGLEAPAIGSPVPAD